jgi:chromatin assembly factor 1 subunit B
MSCSSTSRLSTTWHRCTTMQVYDLAWSPTGEYILAGSTDNVARIFAASDGTCLKEIVEHSHYVQGVAWDPMNEYIATQSSDRSMHVHRVSIKGSSLEVHAVGKNTRVPHRTPSSHSRNKHFRRDSTAASDAESVTTTTSEAIKDEVSFSAGQQPLTPSTTASTPSTSMFPPPPVESSSRRSSFSGSNAPGSPSLMSRYGRSPSPMPALPAIRALPTTSAWASVKLYGDESYTNFFRRLTFSPDGGLLLTPAGQFEDPSVIPGLSDQTSRGRKRTTGESSATSSVYIYTRANFARPPIAQLPGHKKASVAVRFSPILYELRQGVAGFEEPETVVIEKGKEEYVDLNLGLGSAAIVSAASTSPHKHSIPTPTLSPIFSPSPAFPVKSSSLLMPSPALSATDAVSSPTPGRSTSSTPIQQASTPSIVTSSVFALPYRMLYAVATMDTIAIYDTQQAGPVCLLTKLHYDEFTDLTWQVSSIQ